eukprot:3159510-Prymnesium_polylepis.1
MCIKVTNRPNAVYNFTILLLYDGEEISAHTRSRHSDSPGSVPAPCTAPWHSLRTTSSLRAYIRL